MGREGAEQLSMLTLTEDPSLIPSTRARQLTTAVTPAPGNLLSLPSTKTITNVHNTRSHTCMHAHGGGVGAGEPCLPTSLAIAKAWLPCLAHPDKSPWPGGTKPSMSVDSSLKMFSRLKTRQRKAHSTRLPSSLIPQPCQVTRHRPPQKSEQQRERLSQPTS